MSKATLFVGISELVLPHLDEGGSGKEPLDIVKDGALLCDGGLVVAVGDRQTVRQAVASGQSLAEHTRAEDTLIEIDLGGRAVVPGLIDSHTHVVHAGSRPGEFERRAAGATYQEIAALGGGIRASTTALARAPVDQIAVESMSRISDMSALGVTTVECKTGYGLAPELERKHLDAIAAVAQSTEISILATALAHVVPAPVDGGEITAEHRRDHIFRFCEEFLLPAVSVHKGLLRFLDVFVEHGAFSADEARVLAAKATSLGLSIKLHVDQFESAAGAELAAELGALSADHLEQVSASGRRALVAKNVVGTILPGCGLFLGGDNWADGRALRKAGVEVAVATDANPGSSMVTDLPLCGLLSVTQCGLTLGEALWGMTRGGARALGLLDRGSLRPGERADFVVLNSPDWRNLIYGAACGDTVLGVYVGGRRL